MRWSSNAPVKRSEAFLCTGQNTDPARILDWFVLHWQVEVTFEETRVHLGVETQRQWSDKAIARTTPSLMGLYSIVTLAAQRLFDTSTACVRTSAWYPMLQSTFFDRIACVQRQLWSHNYFPTSKNNPDITKILRSLFERLTDMLCYST